MHTSLLSPSESDTQTAANLAHVSVDGGDTFWIMGTTNRIILSRPEFSLVEIVAPPGTGVPLHVHDREDETFIIQTGLMGATFGDSRTKVSVGETIFLPRGVPHAWFNVGDEPLRFYLIVSPGGFENFFCEVGDSVEEFPTAPITSPDMEAMIANLEARGIRFLENGH